MLGIFTPFSGIENGFLFPEKLFLLMEPTGFQLASLVAGSLHCLSSLTPCAFATLGPVNDSVLWKLFSFST